MLIDGKIKLKNDSQIAEFTETGLKFENGSELAADVVVFATGCAHSLLSSMTDKSTDRGSDWATPAMPCARSAGTRSEIVASALGGSTLRARSTGRGATLACRGYGI
jgi:hypothetical protein